MIAAYTFFSSAHRTYTENIYLEPNLNKLKKKKSQNYTEYVSDHSENSPNTWKLKTSK